MIFKNLFTNSLARKLPKVNFEIKTKFLPVPKQEYKDYKVITCRVELLSYFTRCMETGFCSFDFETGPDDEEYRRWHIEESILNEKKNQIIKDLNIWKEKNDEEMVKSLKLMEKEVMAELKEKETFFKRSPLDPHRARICTVSISAAPHESRVIFLDHKIGENHYIYEESRKYAIDSFFKDFNHQILMNPKILKIAYNLSFETKMLLRKNIYIEKNVADPFIMIVRTLQAFAPEEIKDPKNPASGKGLKAMTKRFLDVTMNDFTSVVSESGHNFFNEMSNEDPEALNYSAEDSDYSLQLYNYFLELAEGIKIDDCIYKNYSERLHAIDMPFQRVIGQMEFHGFKWNEIKAKEVKEQAEKEMELARRKIIEIGRQVYYEFKSQGRPDMECLLNLDPGKTGKNSSIRFLLFDVLQCPVASRSDLTNKASLDHEAILDMKFMVENDLAEIEDEYKESKSKFYRHKDYLLRLLNAMDDVQKYGTLLSSHIYGREKFVNPITGRIHASFSPWTETSRLNSFNPNGQNVPRSSTDKFGIRNVYQPAPGKVLILIDYAGFELRLIAWASRDKTMLDILNNDGDIHAKTASTLTGKPESEITKEERMAAKSGNFGIGYGGTMYALRSTYKKMGIRKSLEYCNDVITAVKNTYPRIAHWQEECKWEAQKKGYAQTIYGYRRLLPNINNFNNKLKKEDERRAANTPIQGSAADIMKRVQNVIYDRIASDTYYESISGIPAIFSHENINQIQQFHDEIVLEVSNNITLIKHIVSWIVKEMETPPIENFPVKLVAEVSIAEKSWGNKQDYSDWLKQYENEGKNG